MRLATHLGLLSYDRTGSWLRGCPSCPSKDMRGCLEELMVVLRAYKRCLAVYNCDGGFANQENEVKSSIGHLQDALQGIINHAVRTRESVGYAVCGVSWGSHDHTVSVAEML